MKVIPMRRGPDDPRQIVINKLIDTCWRFLEDAYFFDDEEGKKDALDVIEGKRRTIEGLTRYSKEVRE